MPSADQIRGRLASYDDLHAIVKTMKALSAASIRQYEEAAQSLEAYDRTVGLALRAVLARVGPPDGATVLDAAGPAVIVAFGSNHGLCGRLNEDVATSAARHIQRFAASGRAVHAIAVGARIAPLLARTNVELDASIDAPGSVGRINAAVQDIMLAADSRLGRSGSGTMSVVYVHRTDAAVYRATHRQVLPAALPAVETNHEAWPRRTRPMLSMPAIELLHSLQQQQLFVAVFRACAESQASEHGSRLVAMTSAQRNIESRIVDATLAARRLRQDAITAELLDVVAGYEALSGAPSAAGFR